MSMCIYHGNLALADAAYLAGLIDGEGSIAVSRTKTSASAKACKRGFAYRASVTPFWCAASLGLQAGEDVKTEGGKECLHG